MTFIKPLPLALAALLMLSPFAPAAAQQAYATPEEAAQALVDALGVEKADSNKLTTLLGPDYGNLVPDGSVDRADVDAFLAKYAQRHAIEVDAKGQSLLSVGDDPWTLPVPLAQGPGGWSFDIKAGMEEVRVRRIGRNELDAIQSVLTYNDAQMDYAESDHDGDGVLEYARKLLSTDGLHDGLFWSDDDSGEISPLGPLFGDAEPGSDWHGYRFHILQAQGESAPGGAYDYALGDNMSRGFALVAWPADYGDTGVKTFMISHEGQVFEKDLGPNAEKIASAMTLFNPDDSWTLVPTAAN